MKDFLKLTDFSSGGVEEIFGIADGLAVGVYRGALSGKTVIMFFPETSLRTRVTFEKGIHQLGGQTILFPPDVLDKKEDIRDVCGYMENWADLVIVRHRDIGLLEKMAENLSIPVINAMTEVNHPCEVLSDLYSLSKLRDDIRRDEYLFVGKCGNIGLSWKNASEVLGFGLTQCCGRGYELPDIPVSYDIREAVRGKDIICTDALPADILDDFRGCQVTAEVMKLANRGALLNPCPPFYRGEEVSADAINSEFFVGYGFKKSLLELQQAIILKCMQLKES